MCERCLPPLSRRQVLGLAGAVTAAALLGPPNPAAAARAFQTGYGVAIEPRATWAGDSRPTLATPPDETVRFLLVHHTAGPSEGDPIELMRQVYDFHTGPEKGWPDVAYNFFVEPGGRVFEARAGSLSRAVEASATGGNQGFAQLVCLLGDFTSRNPTDAQLASLNQTLAWLADRYGLDTSPGATSSFTSRGSNRWSAGTEVTADIISGHREMSATACPGDTFFPYLKERVQAEVHTLRGSPQAPVEEPDTSSTQVPASTQAPVPTTEPVSSTPSVVVSSTAAPQPVSTTTVPPDTVATVAAPTTALDPSVAPGSVPSGGEFADRAAGVGQAATGRTSTSVAPWTIGAGAATVAAAAAGALYLGARSRRETGETSPHADDSQRPPPGGADPLA